jgi:hypothetical protein
MTTIVDSHTGFGITSWGYRDNHRLWRVRWLDRPNMVCEITGPDDTEAAFTKAWNVRERLPWVAAPPAC